MKNIYKIHTKIINLKYQLRLWNEEFALPDGSFLYQIFKITLNISLKKRQMVTDNPSIMIYVHEIENKITFKIKTRYYLEILKPETMKLLGSTKRKITKDKNGENLPHLEITEVVFIHCKIVNKDYQQNSRVSYTFVPNKLFGQLLDISSKKFIFLKTFNSEFPYIEVWFTDQNSKPIEIEDKTKITLVINKSVK